MAIKPLPSIFMPRQKRKATATQPRPKAPKQPTDTSRPTLELNFDDRTPELLMRRSNADGVRELPTLYEGSYNAWIMVTRDSFSCPKYQTLFRDLDSPGFIVMENRLVKSCVRPQSLDRVPDHIKNDTIQLLGYLEKPASPFRLMDLPAEIRVSIFTLALHQRFGVNIFFVAHHVFSNPDGKLRAYDKPPPLTVVCHAIREEAMPIYYEVNNIQMNFGRLFYDKTHNVTNPEIEDECFIMLSDSLQSQAVSKWAEANKCWLKHLRQVTVSFELSPEPSSFGKPMEIKTTYSPVRGLVVRWPRYLPLKDRFQARADRVESYCRLFKLEGEVLAMLWMDGVKLFEGQKGGAVSEGTNMDEDTIMQDAT